MKKSYNPFKMKLPLILAGIFFVYTFFSFFLHLPDILDALILSGIITGFGSTKGIWTDFFWMTFIGFFLGWLIQILFTKKTKSQFRMSLLWMAGIFGASLTLYFAINTILFLIFK